MHALKFAALLAIPSGLHAFKDTYPLLAWSSSSSSALDAISSQPHLMVQAENPFVVNEDVCGYDAVVVVEQPGLHTSDLRTLPTTSFLASHLKSAASSFHIPYLQSANPVGLAHEISKQCGSKLLQLQSGQKLGDSNVSEKFVVSIDLPELDSMCRQRKADMNELDAKLSQQLDALSAMFPSHLVIVAGTTPSSFSRVKRQLSDLQRALPAAFGSSASPSPSPDKPFKHPTGGILHRYQLLTPGLITSLGITFLLIMPLILMVVSAVAGIKSPVRSEGLKHAQDKKNQ